MRHLHSHSATEEYSNLPNDYVIIDEEWGYLFNHITINEGYEKSKAKEAGWLDFDPSYIERGHLIIKKEDFERGSAFRRQVV